MIGARGGVASVVSTGLAALQQGQVESVGLVSELPEFAGLQLVGWDSIVVGGHEIRDRSLVDEVRQFQQSSRAFAPELIDQVAAALETVDTRIRPGIVAQAGPAILALADPAIANDRGTARDKIRQLQSDLREFVDQHDLQRVVVINVASTEPPWECGAQFATWGQLEPALDQADCPLPSSCLYAIAALDLGHAYVNFTPSPGCSCPAVQQLADARRAAHAGRDGKTGETLIKSVLAPAFAMRHLKVMSWVGHNIFGNLDGQVLDDPANKQSKVASKDQLLGQILGYQPQSHISIEYIRSLGDWKTAWDHVHFQGFLGTPMVMQFTWQGCDSILAAPLVLDLLRFAERAQRAGQYGNLDWLACFFKSPAGTAEHNLTLQYQRLRQWADATRDW